MRVNICLFDSHNINESDYEEGYRYEIEVSDRQDFSLSDYIAESISREYDDTLENLRHCHNNLCECVVIGTLGLWNGKVKVVKKFTCLYEAVRACSQSMDYITIKQKNGHLELNGYHHDGTNRYEIYLLNEKGQSTYGDLSNKRYHKAIQGYVF